MTDASATANDQEIDRLSTLLLQMGSRVETMFKDSLAALVRRNAGLAERVIATDPAIEAARREIEEIGVQILALRQPVAGDLRIVVASLRVAADLGRVGQCARNVARCAIALNQQPAIRLAASVPRIGKLAGEMLKDVIDAYEARDADKAHAVWCRDEEVDGLYHGLFRELLTYMMEDPRNITPCTDIVFIAKNVERVGDHATNIAEAVYFIVHGVEIPDDRPKGDAPAATVRP